MTAFGLRVRGTGQSSRDQTVGHPVDGQVRIGRHRSSATPVAQFPHPFDVPLACKRDGERKPHRPDSALGRQSPDSLPYLWRAGNVVSLAGLAGRRLAEVLKVCQKIGSEVWRGVV